ncbi:MAG: 30S ribosomal protein S20 [Deltaproteobacteria bacterium]|nr:30S ribosomal protein S20 [Deltaproteobacteria bacterium]
MAVHPSVIKRHRQSVTKRLRNQEIKSWIRTLIKKARRAIELQDRDGISVQLKEVNRALGKAVSRGILKPNTASRWLSRLARSAHRLAATQ